MNKTIFLFLCLFPALARPQATETEPGTITKVVRVRSAERIAAMTQTNGVAIRGNNELGAIVIKGKPGDVAAAEKTIRELDSASGPRGSRNLELTVYLLNGSNTASAGTPEDKVPAIIPVVKQLRAVFPYNEYRLVSTMLLRSGEGTKASSNGVLKGFENTAEFSRPSTYFISYDSASISADETAPTIHLSRLHFDLEIAIPNDKNNVRRADIGLATDVDLREGQKVVVGKSNIDNLDAALFVVLVARLVP